MRLRLLSKKDVQRALPMKECIELMKAAFAQLSSGQAHVPLRSQLPVTAHEGVTIFMPAYLAQSGDLGVKIVSVFPRNVKADLPTIHAVGAYTPQMQKVDSETIRRAKVVIDSRQASLVEAGDLIIPLQQGLITEKHIYAEIGEIVAGQKAARESKDEITYFKSVGIAVQDVAAARRVLDKATEMGLGQEVEL